MCKNILVCCSGRGSNLQALMDAQAKKDLGGGEITGVLSDRPGVYALERAQGAGIPTFVLEPDRSLPRPQRRREHSDRILKLCRDEGIDLIVHAGFLSVLAGEILDVYNGRIINIHPALLPKYGGQGMYGIHVHRAVLAAGETESGCTVHLVDQGIDSGTILLQRKVPVLPIDSPELLAERVLYEEHIAIAEGVRMILHKINYPSVKYYRSGTMEEI